MCVCGGEMCLLPVQSGMLKGTWVLDGARRAPENCTQPGGRHGQEQQGYLKLQVALGLLSEHVFLQLVVLVSSTAECRFSCFLMKGFPLYIKC